ncbi:MAG TPA: amidohydrolase family protein [Blastocatellia bacterium]|nr:amidohydrolase family protein [Blastocatellia bacterium]
MLTLIENGELFAPEPRGRQSVLLCAGKVVKVGAVDRRAIEALGVEVDVIDAAGCLVVPGFIDPHEHLLGGSGESGFSTQTPEIHLREVVSAGVTTVVGALGVDTTMKTMAGLLAKAKALREEGLTAYVWTGGYNVPPTTITDSVRNDLMFIAEVIGAGEVAIADERSTDPRPDELARLVKDAYVGGMLSRKAGVTHFHVGDKPERLRLLRTLIDDFDLSPGLLYPTHVERSEELMREAVELSRRGAFVDVDTVEEDLPKWLRFYLDHGGEPKRLTASSDASITGPHHLFSQVAACIVEHGFAVERALPLVTSNTADVLKLESKGRIAPGKDADLLTLKKDSLEINHVIAGGRPMIRDGRLVQREAFLRDSDRRISPTD